MRNFGYRRAAQAAVTVMLAMGTICQFGCADMYRKAAEQGDALSQVNLGFCYHDGGRGVEKDPREAVKWFRKAAEQGNPSGEYMLGYCYAYGDGVGKDKAEATIWLRKAYADGITGAEGVLETLYYEPSPLLPPKN